MVNKREKKIAVSDDHTAEVESGSSESPSRPAKRRTTSRQPRSAAPTIRQDNGSDVSVETVEILGSTPGVHEQPSQPMMDMLGRIDSHLGLLETSIQESARQARQDNMDLAQKLGEVEGRVQKAEAAIEKLCRGIADKDDGLGALNRSVRTAQSKLENSDKTVGKLDEWANKFVLERLPGLVAQHNSAMLNESKIVLNSTLDRIQEMRTGTMEYLGSVGQKITELERRLDRSVSLLIEHNSEREVSMVKSAGIVLDQVQAITRAQAEAEKEVLQHLQVFWQRVEETDSGMRRGIAVNSSLRLMRKKLLRSYIELLSNLKCQVELGDEAVEMALVPYDGLAHRWDRSDGEEVAKRHEMATVFLPGWKLGNHNEKPLLGRMVEGDNR